MKIILLFLFTSMLTACNSFNTLVLTSYELTNTETYTEANDLDVLQKETIKREIVNIPVDKPNKPQETLDIQRIKGVQYCPVYVIPDAGMEPTLSLERLKQTQNSKNDLLEFDKVVVGYNNSLLKYIRDFRSRIDRSYQEYLKKCEIADSVK